MTTEIVNVETGEIIDSIGATEARRITTEAQNEFRSGAAHNARGWELVEEAVKGGGHLNLGYRSPGEYLAAEFDNILAGFNITERRIAVRTMTGWGLSTRAIAKPLGVGKTTVERDINQVAHVGQVDPTFVSATDALAETNSKTSQDAPETPLAENGISEPAEVPEAEGAEPAPVHPNRESEADVDSIGSAGEEDDGSLGAVLKSTPPTPLAPVIGIDGKTYKRPEKKTPRRKPLPDSARDAGWELRKSVERIQRIADDDRFVTNKNEVAAHLRGHLTFAAEVLADLLDRINN